MQHLENQVVTFLSTKLGTCIESSDISVYHLIGNKTSNKPDNVIVRFINMKSKIELLQRAKALKGTDIYVDEHLATKNSQLAYTARILLKQGKISKNCTRDCKILIKSLGSPEIARTHIIKNESDFEYLHLHAQIHYIVCMANVCISVMFMLLS